MANVPPFLLIGTAVVCVGVLFHVIGLATTHWHEVDRYKTHTGLFRGCIRDHCGDLSSESSKLKAVRALTIIGMLAGGGGAALAMILVVCRLLSKNAPKVISLFSAALCFAAFVFILIGIIVYGTDDDVNDYGNLGYSFALCIVGAILLGGGGGLVFLGGRTVAA